MNSKSEIEKMNKMREEALKNFNETVSGNVASVSEQSTFMNEVVSGPMVKPKTVK